MHKDEAMRIYLREKFADFLLAQRRVAIAKKQIDAAFDFHVQTGLVARVNPFRETRSSETLLGGRENFGIVLARDDAPEAVGFEPFRNAQSAQPGKGACLNDEFRLGCGDDGLQKIEHFDFGAHRIVHVPALGMRAFRRGAVIFRLENVAARSNVLYDAMLFFPAAELALNAPK